MMKEVDFKRKRYCNSNKMYFCQHLNHSWNNKNCIKFLIKSFLLILQRKKILIIYQFNNLKYLQYLAIVIYLKNLNSQQFHQNQQSEQSHLTVTDWTQKWHPVPGVGQTQPCGGLDWSMGPKPPLNNWISNGNTYVNNDNIPAR